MSPFGVAEIMFDPSKHTADSLAVNVPAEGATTFTGAPATSRSAQISPPPGTINPSTSTPVVTPNSTMPRSSVIGSYTNVWIV